ncbi:LacI family DNA-binding transcriptional regulator [Amycolatopsis sp. NPDC004378]
MVTIYQVAEAAGVSPSTVSNYLNGRTSRMQAGTRTRIEHAISRLGYRPNQAARQLRTGRARVVGLVVPSVANPFWGTFARHLEGAALAEGYHVLLCNSEREPERERGYLEELWDDGVRGVVLCSALPSLAHVTSLVERGMRLVAFDRTAQPDDPPGLVNVAVDNAVGSGLATRHLIDLGHRRLAFVSGSLASVNRTERLRGFRGALAAAGLSTSDCPVADDRAYGDVDMAGVGRAAVTGLLAEPAPPTAVVAINDLCALGVCAGLRDAGLRVGADVSVTGFDDIMLADLAAPPLTTVRQPVARMAAAAFAHLRDRIDGRTPEAGESLLFRPELVVRDSTAPPR